MKMILSLKYWAAIALLAFSGASSASVWAPSDGNINLLSFSSLAFPISLSSEKFGIFEDNVNLSTDAPVITFIGGTTVGFASNGANYLLTSGASSGTLLGSNNFQLAWWSGSSWKFEIASVVNPLGNLLYFSNSSTPNSSNTVSLLAIDVVRSHATSDGPSAVPLPASIWMMGSAIFGLLFAGRRKSLATA